MASISRVAAPVTTADAVDAEGAAMPVAPVSGQIEPLPLPAGATPSNAEAAADAGLTNETIALVALAMLGLIPIGIAIMAMIWWRRRSRRVSDMRAAGPLTASAIAAEARTAEPDRRPPVFDREPRIPVETAPVAPTALAGTAFGGRPAPDTANGVAVLERPVAPPRREPLPNSAFLPQDGKVILPDTAPQTYEERDRLMRGLVAQKPDAANPFRSPKARARRARLIIQSLGRRFDTVRPRFDLGQYSYRWPHLAPAKA